MNPITVFIVGVSMLTGIVSQIVIVNQDARVLGETSTKSGSFGKMLPVKKEGETNKVVPIKKVEIKKEVIKKILKNDEERMLNELKSLQIREKFEDMVEKTSTVSKIQVCPDEWMINNMPQSIENIATKSAISKVAKPTEYFMVNGKKVAKSNFDLAWMEKNCGWMKDVTN